MIAPAKPAHCKPIPPWHAGFLAMLPVIHTDARGAFAHLNPEARQDMIQEVIAKRQAAHAALAYDLPGASVRG
jgi:hypothetical protein